MFIKKKGLHIELNDMIVAVDAWTITKRYIVPWMNAAADKLEAYEKAIMDLNSIVGEQKAQIRNMREELASLRRKIAR